MFVQIISVLFLVLFVFGFGFMLGGNTLKNQFILDKDEKENAQKYMDAFWVTSPSKFNFWWYPFAIVLALFMVFFSYKEYRDDVLKAYDKGDIVKVVTYKTVEKPGHEPVRDSTFRYEKN